MKNPGLFFLYLLCAGLLFEVHAQSVPPERAASCFKSRTALEKPVECWIELLSSREPDTRLYAAENLSRLGPQAEAAVPALAKMVDDPDGRVRGKVFEALTQIAEDCESCPAAKVLLEILDRSPNSLQRRYAWRSLTVIYKTAFVGGQALPGWPGVFPQESLFWGRLTRPLISDDGKKYSQSFTRNEMSEMFDYSKTETLARDPDFARRYADEALKKEADPPFAGYVGKRKVLAWPFKTAENTGKTDCAGGRSRIVVILAPDKTWTSETCYSSVRFPLPLEKPKATAPVAPDLKYLNELLPYFDRLEAALNNLPRTDFRRNLELFKPLKKGMSLAEVWNYAGHPNDYYFVGEGITLAVYELIDESKVILKYTYPDKTINFFSRDRPWKLESATRQPKYSQPPEMFIK